MKSETITSTILTKHFKTTVFISLTLMLEFILLFPTTSVAKTTMVEAPVSANGCPATLDFNLRRLAKSEEVNLCDAYKGKVVLIVNTASKCGYTGQFDGLEALYNKYKDKGLVVLGFPSNDFANQDPENEQNIAKNSVVLLMALNFPCSRKHMPPKATPRPYTKPWAEWRVSFLNGIFINIC